MGKYPWILSLAIVLMLFGAGLATWARLVPKAARPIDVPQSTFQPPATEPIPSEKPAAQEPPSSADNQPEETPQQVDTRESEPAPTPPPAPPARTQVLLLGFLTPPLASESDYDTTAAAAVLTAFSPDIILAQVPPSEDLRTDAVLECRNVLNAASSSARVIPVEAFSLDAFQAQQAAQRTLRRTHGPDLAEAVFARERTLRSAEHSNEIDSAAALHESAFAQTYWRSTAQLRALIDAETPLGPSHVNDARWNLIAAQLDTDTNSRIAILFDITEHAWLAERLGARNDLDMVEVAPLAP